MCDVKRNDTYCVRVGKWWVRRASMNSIVCTHHLPSTIEQMKAVDWQTAHPNYHLTARDDVIVKLRNETENGYTVFR